MTTLIHATLRMASLTVTIAAALPAFAQAPAPYEPTPAMIEAAKKEGKAVWYTSTDVGVSQRMAKLFEAKYPGVTVQVERSGAERVYQRINQEYGSNIKNADVIETSDAVHFIVFKRKGWLAQALPSDVAKHWPKNARDAEGYYAAYRSHLSVMGYNTKLLKAEDAPKSRADLLDPKWRGRLVKAHPGYSGTVLNDTFVIVNTKGLGWDYLAKLGQQRVMQVQSSTEPPKKLALGERLVQVDGNEYNVFQLKEKGDPVDAIYPTEGTTIAIGHSAVLKESTRPNAARLLYHFLYTKEAQQAMSDEGGLRSFHPDVKEKATRTPLSKIKVLYPDATKLEGEVENIKKSYEKHFGT